VILLTKEEIDIDELLRQEGKGMSDILDFNQAADLLKISHPTLYRWLSEAKIKAFKAGKQWRFYRKDLLHFMQTEDTEEMGDYLDLNKIIEFFIQRLKIRDINLPQKEVDYEGKTEELLYLIFIDAYSQKATDIHINPSGKEYELLYRIERNLSKVVDLSETIVPLLIKEINKAFRLKETLKKGKILFKWEVNIEIKVSVIETIQGKKYTMQLLDLTGVIKNLRECLPSDEDLKKIIDMIERPHGLILITGPPGSGKSTLAYSILKEKKEKNLNLMTLEEHVEYILEGVHQIQIIPERGYYDGLQAIIEADADIIMFDNLKNSEVAYLCIEAATKYLVIAQMLARNPFNAIQRFWDMSIDPRELANTLTVITSQKLLRKICPDCYQEYRPDEKMMETFPDLFSHNTILVKATGCAKCNFTGYKDLIVIYEIFIPDEEIKYMIARRSRLADIRQKAMTKGMKTFQDQGIILLNKRLTTLEEVTRITGIEPTRDAIVY